jgi:uncharacterized membrane protein YsdA (DUF1294 family)
MMQYSRGNPVRRFTICTFGTALAAAWLMHWQVNRLDVLQCWLIAVTAVTFLAYGYDKFTAIRGWTRIPERVLLGLAFTGGTLGALTGMSLFRHKTIKKGFRIKFWFLVVVQIALVAAYYSADPAWLKGG